jgi:hypothetical protein
MPDPKTETKDTKITEKDSCLNKMKKILEEAGGLESNIGMNSEYWELQRKYRSL